VKTVPEERGEQMADELPPEHVVLLERDAELTVVNALIGPLATGEVFWWSRGRRGSARRR
jgi:hypothetical protein